MPSIAQTLTGTVNEIDDTGKSIPIVGALLKWQGTASGTFTDKEGNYSLVRVSSTNLLLVSYPTYDTDTIEVSASRNELNIVLARSRSLQAVEVVAAGGSYVSVKPILTNVISTEGLRRAACCNLSESFENTVAVDVEYSDAVSGAKQISMLGLAGVYSQILLENVPYVRLLSNQFGLGFIPGTWMEMISISKGTSSVVNGYEAITGQIDVEYKKPETNHERLFINLYGNIMGKAELNLNSRFAIKNKENVSTMLLVHAEAQMAKIDMNKDGFLDLPLNRQVNVMNRWDYRHKALEGRTMIGYLFEDRIGGQKEFDPKQDRPYNHDYWGMRIKTHKVDFITKNGFLLKGENEGIGTIVSFNFQDNNSYFGLRDYQAQQISGYANLFYSNKFGATARHKLTTGFSMQADNLKENLRDIRNYDIPISPWRTELVPGIFAEYSYSIADKFIIMPGFRVDYNLMYKQLFWTPRLHIKWQMAKNSSVRASVGKGYRTANVIVENLSLLVSNRDFVYQYDNKGLKPEEAYNAGISFVQNFKVNGGNSSFSVDYFYTHFINQTIIDLDKDSHSVYVYNLNDKLHRGTSYSHSFQADLTLTPFTRFEVVLAYRYNDVRLTTAGKLQKKALVSPHKALLNLNYATKFNRWKFSATLQYNSSMRLPIAKNSPDFLILNAQITYKYKGWEFYIGGENLTNYKQKDPIMGAENPFGSHFDASIIYAPIIGAMGYAGFRFTLK
ncbi:MAG: TonB-dependent receptor [Bacteroidales bacterium]|nr:TonB-dependent receptor [Bacteroidales bacterium]